MRNTTDTWVAIDFETATGERTSACALGLAVIEGLDVVATQSWLIQPPFNEYNWFNTRLHGIGPDDTALAPEFDEVWWEVATYLESGQVLAHNASFDAGVLRSLLDARELSGPRIRYACTVGMSRKAFTHLPKHSLDIVCDHCGIKLRHHDAASDAEGCARVAIECARSVGARGIGEALDLLGVKQRVL